MKLGRMRVLASESLIYGVSAIFTRFISVFLVPVYTRLFSPEDYGILSLVTSTYAVVAVFAVLALDSASGRWFWDSELESDRKRTIATAAWSQIASAIVFGVALYFASDRLAILVVHRADTALYFRLLAITLPFAQFGTVVSGWLRLQRRPVAATVYALGTSLLQIAVTLFFVVGMHWGLKGIYSAQVLSLTVGAFAALALLKDWINPAWFDFVRLKAMLMFALPLIPSALAMWVVGFADRYFVEMFDSTSEVGLFSLGSSLAQGMFLLTGAFQMAWGPFALSIHKEPDAKRTYAQAFLAYLGVTTFIATGLSLFAP
ncbi:MAG: oligosaccharide flippase family protein, partial [Gemmatimonadaceae bacterium]